MQLSDMDALKLISSASTELFKALKTQDETLQVLVLVGFDNGDTPLFTTNMTPREVLAQASKAAIIMTCKPHAFATTVETPSDD